VPREYGAAEYQLKITPADSDDPLMIPVPTKYWKPVCLALDAMSGVPRRVELTDAGEQSRVSLNFAPPQAQMRWLNAIGAEWEHPKLNQLHWRFDSSHVESVKAVFERLPVEIADAIKEVCT
jgi:hypothetical protein